MCAIVCWPCADEHHEDCDREHKVKRDSDFVLEASVTGPKYIKADQYVRCDCLARRRHG